MLKKILPKNRFAKAVSVLAGGAASAQLIVVGVSPILTRLYTPEEFGLLAVFSAILGILVVISSMRYQLSIPLPKDDEQALMVAFLCLLVLIILTFFLSISVWFFGDIFLDLLNTPGLGPYTWLIPVGFAFIGIQQILQNWFLRFKAFGLIAQARMAQSLSVAGLQIILSSFGSVGLIGGRVLGQFFANYVFITRKRILVWPIKFDFSFKNILFVAKKYRQFPIFSSWSGLLNAGGAQVPSLFFASVYGPAAAGGYMLAQRIINMPLTVIGSAVAQAFLPSSIDALRENNLDRQVTKLISALASLVLPGAIVLFFIAPEFFQFIFGHNWRIAGELVRCLSPMLAIQFIVNPVSRVFVTLERQDLALYFQICLFLLRIGALLAAYVFGFSLIESVKLFSLASVLGYILYLYAICRVVNLEFLRLIISEYQVGFSSLLVIVSGFYFNVAFDGVFPHIMVLIIGVLAFFLNVYTLKPKIMK